MWKKIVILLISAVLSLNVGMSLTGQTGSSDKGQDLLLAGRLENKVKEALNYVGRGGYQGENILEAADMKALVEDVYSQACRLAIAQFDDGERTEVKTKADELLYTLFKGGLTDVADLGAIEGLD